MSREGSTRGPVIVDGNIRYTSVSALQTFDPETYGGCPRRYFFKYVMKKPEPQTKAMAAGTEIHKQLEHYLLSGEDVLGPVARAGKHFLPRPGADLIVEKDFGDETRALRLREDRIRSNDSRLDSVVAQTAGLSVAGIPLVGYIDVRHARGEYVDEEGNLRRELPQYGRVTEVVDHKSTSNLDYAKTSAELADALQMVGYANVKTIIENSDSIRLSHISYQTRGAKAAKKATTIISAAVARRKWERVERLAPAMSDVVRARRPEDVDVQLKSCNAYHPGCPHQSYCDRPQITILDVFQITKGESNMSASESLFDIMKAPSAGTNGVVLPQNTLPPPLPMTDAVRTAAIEAERARLLAEDAAPAVSYGFCMSCGASLTAANASRLQSGLVRHIACPKDLPLPVPHIGAVNPVDAPPPDFIAAAAPLSAEVIATIADPELRARATEHAKAHAERAAANAPAASDKPKSGRCVAGGQTFALTREEGAKGKKVCPSCGKLTKITPSADYESTVMPAHNMPKVETAASTAPTATAATLPPAPPPLPAAPTVRIKVEGDDGVMRPFEFAPATLPPPLPLPLPVATVAASVATLPVPPPLTVPSTLPSTASCVRCSALEQENEALRQTVHVLTAKR